MKVPSIPCSGVPAAGPNDPGSSDSVYWPLLALQTAMALWSAEPLVAQAEDRGGVAAAGQERGDVAVLAAVADDGLALRATTTNSRACLARPLNQRCAAGKAGCKRSGGRL